MIKTETNWTIVTLDEAILSDILHFLPCPWVTSSGQIYVPRSRRIPSFMTKCFSESFVRALKYAHNYKGVYLLHWKRRLFSLCLKRSTGLFRILLTYFSFKFGSEVPMAVRILRSFRATCCLLLKGRRIKKARNNRLHAQRILRPWGSRRHQSAVPKWVGSTWKRRQNPVSVTSCFK
jgi:hypothetical protein